MRNLSSDAPAVSSEADYRRLASTRAQRRSSSPNPVVLLEALLVNRKELGENNRPEGRIGTARV